MATPGVGAEAPSESRFPLVHDTEEKRRKAKAVGVPEAPLTDSSPAALDSSPGISHRRTEAGSPRWMLAVVACLCYCTTSIAITLSNKGIMNSYGFQYPLFLTVFQNGFVAFFIFLLSSWGFIHVEPLEWDKVKTWMPLNLAFVLMLIFSQLSLGRISVAMVTVFKNFTTIAITLGDRIFFDNPISPYIAASLAVMAGGSIVAGYNDLEFRLDGYIFLVLNCVFQTTYVLYMNKVMRVLKLDKWSSMYYNNVISIPLLIPCFMLFQELDTVFLAEAWSAPYFGMVLFINGGCSFGISLCSFWAMSVTSPTTYSMVGSFNKIPLAILGSIAFRTPFTFMGKVSTTVGLSGALLYSWAKARQQMEKKKALERQSSAS